MASGVGVAEHVALAVFVRALMYPRATSFMAL
jgi:hypothetical protein